MKQIYNILKYNQITSTNDEAKKLLQKISLPNFTVISAKEQTKGKGQRGNIWQSETNSNLLFSIITYPDNLKASEQFYLSKAVSLGIIDYFNQKKEGFKIKWPNDIFYNDKKICGILIENTISGSKIKNSIIGIGVNLNQVKFPENLHFAASVRNITDKIYDTEKELILLLNYLFENYQKLKIENFSTIDKKYHNNLYKINELSEFKDKNGTFSGTISGCLSDGRLIIKTVDNKLRYYNFKEVEFIKK